MEHHLHDPTLRNTIADYHTRYQRPCPACDTSTTRRKRLSFASFVRRVAFLDRNTADVLLRISLAQPMQRCIFLSPTHSGRCVFRSIEALVSPDACPADTPIGIPSLVKRKRRRRRKFLHRTKKLLFFLGCAITRLIRFVK